MVLNMSCTCSACIRTSNEFSFVDLLVILTIQGAERTRIIETDIIEQRIYILNAVALHLRDFIFSKMKFRPVL